MLCGIAGAGLIAAALAACGDSDGGSSNSGSKPKQATRSADGAVVLARTGEVNVNSGVVVTTPDGDPIVVVQPQAGTFKAFSAVCTHQGTTINAPVDGVMTCPNHGSQFFAANGSVKRGPAARALAPVEIKVQGTDIVLA